MSDRVTKQNGTIAFGLDIGIQECTIVVVESIIHEVGLGYFLRILHQASPGLQSGDYIGTHTGRRIANGSS